LAGNQIIAAMLLMATSGATAQPAAPNCPAEAVPLPAELAGWPARTPLTAAADAAGTQAATLAIGKAVDLALRPASDMRYARTPEKPTAGNSHAGMVSFTVDRAGTYRVALGTAAWIDVVRDGTAIMSIGHGHGPACSGIRKLVDFPLTPGRYVLQITGNATAETSALVVRQP
jgi:hypothetical protein